MKKVIFVIFISLLFSACAERAAWDNVLINNDNNMKITSPAFIDYGKIPSEYTCDGENVNPKLLVEGIPAAAKTLALIVDDPDAPGRVWLHWTVWNIPSTETTINKNSLPAGAVEGVTDFGKSGWGGPCPPSGEHRYFFKVYALDTKLALTPGASLSELEAAIKGHILDKAELVGVYSRE